jgi:hypothetical protein
MRVKTKTVELTMFTASEEADVLRLILAAMSQSNQTKTLAGVIKANASTSMQTYDAESMGEQVLQRVAKNSPALYDALHIALNNSAYMPGGSTAVNSMVDFYLNQTFAAMAQLLTLVWNQSEWNVPPDHPRGCSLLAMTPETTNAK